MQNKPIRIGPVALAAAAANIFNPGTTTGGVGMGAGNGNLVAFIKHLRLSNSTGAPVTVNLFVGASAGSAAGTQIIPAGYSIPANNYVDFWYSNFRLDVADFLTGFAGSAAAVQLEGEAELGIA